MKLKPLQFERQESRLFEDGVHLNVKREKLKAINYDGIDFQLTTQNYVKCGWQHYGEKILWRDQLVFCVVTILYHPIIYYQTPRD